MADAHYSKSVGYYDRHIQIYKHNNQNPPDLIDEFLDLLRGQSNNDKNVKRRILDLGCGPGVNTGYMQSKCFQVIGIDPSKKMIEYARKTYPYIEFHVADKARLSFTAEDSFYGILASYSLIHLIKEIDTFCLGKTL